MSYLNNSITDHFLAEDKATKALDLSPGTETAAPFLFALVVQFTGRNQAAYIPHWKLNGKFRSLQHEEDENVPPHQVCDKEDSAGSLYIKRNC